VNYEVDKTIRHTRGPVWAIKRLSVAVVVNHRKLVDDAGTASNKPLAPQEMEQINALVKEVMGYNKERGDSLNVTNSAFSIVEVEPAPEVPLWKQPETIATLKDIGRYGLIAGVVLFLVLGVLRPLLMKLSEQPLPVQAEPVEAGAYRAQRHAGLDDSLNAAKQLARQEPRLVANVVKDWVSGDE
jgi:flagellar M-ring protein FliF